MLSVQGATSGQQVPGVLCHISTHAPRAGSDPLPPCSEQPCTISIHAPRAGSDVQKQSCPRSGRYFNPRSPCGERQGPALGTGLQITISIHAPRAGSDKWPYHTRGCPKRFQSTLPVRGATRIISLFPIVWYGFQSTLPVRGATGKVPVTIQAHRNFNPRSPCGERQRRCPKRNRLF